MRYVLGLIMLKMIKEGTAEGTAGVLNCCKSKNEVQLGFFFFKKKYKNKQRLGSYSFKIDYVRYGLTLVMITVLKHGTTRKRLESSIVEKAKIRYGRGLILLKLMR